MSGAVHCVFRLLSWKSLKKKKPIHVVCFLLLFFFLINMPQYSRLSYFCFAQRKLRQPDLVLFLRHHSKVLPKTAWHTAPWVPGASFSAFEDSKTSLLHHVKAEFSRNSHMFIVVRISLFLYATGVKFWVTMKAENCEDNNFYASSFPFLLSPVLEESFSNTQVIFPLVTSWVIFLSVEQLSVGVICPDLCCSLLPICYQSIKKALKQKRQDWIAVIFRWAE